MKPKLPTLFILATLLATVAGCSRVYIFDGIVVDGDGQPIVDATIIVYPLDWEQPSLDRTDGVSDSDGAFEANWGNAVGVEYFRMIVSKDGYREHNRLVEADEKNLRIVLERMSNGADSMRDFNVDHGLDLPSRELTFSPLVQENFE